LGCFTLNLENFPRLVLIAKNYEIYSVGASGCSKQRHFRIGSF